MPGKREYFTFFTYMPFRRGAERRFFDKIYHLFVRLPVFLFFFLPPGGGGGG